MTVLRANGEADSGRDEVALTHKPLIEVKGLNKIYRTREGDKIEAEARLGFSVNGYGIGDLVPYIDGACDADVTNLCAEYTESYQVASELRKGGERFMQ